MNLFIKFISLEIIDCNNHNGWFVGDLKPNLFKPKFEFGYKRIPGFKARLSLP